MWVSGSTRSIIIVIYHSLPSLPPPHTGCLPCKGRETSGCCGAKASVGRSCRYRGDSTRIQVLQSILSCQLVTTADCQRSRAKGEIIFDLSTTLLLGHCISFLQKHGLKVYLRNPNSFTPLRGTDQSLLLGNDMRENEKQIAQFSVRDAEVRLHNA